MPDCLMLRLAWVPAAFDVQLSRCWHDVVVNATIAGPAGRIAPLLLLRIALRPSARGG